MKIIFLNAFYGQLENLGEFIKDQAFYTDVFCFQEAGPDFLKICKETLNDYKLVSATKTIQQEGEPPDAQFFQAIFVKKRIVTALSGEIPDDNPRTGLGLYVRVLVNNKAINICNFHGVPLPGHKLDTKNRLEQSEKIIKYFQKVDGKKIIGGDFNVLPQAKGIKMFENAGYRNLIDEYGIKTTRNKIAWENYPGHEQYFSDYVFVSSDVKVNKFLVPEVIVSDHLPLILEIEV